MKKFFSVLMIAVLAAMPFAAMAEETDTLLEGLVTEIVDNGFMMEDPEHGEVLLNTSDVTVWDGLLAEGELAVGQYVYVEYDGRMTFSRPPQAHADRVTCAVLTGMVTEVLEDGSILMEEDTFGETIVHVGEGTEHIYAGMPITVYYDGVMTLSLPGQANASYIVLPELTGTVSGKTEEGFTLTDENGTEYEVKFSEETLISELLPAASAPEEDAVMEENAAGETLTDEKPAEEGAAAETAAEEEEPAEAAAEASEEAAEETPEEDPEATLEDAALAEEDGHSAVLLSESGMEWADGDKVTVYYNGMMTRSIPAQITAMEIVVIR